MIDVPAVAYSAFPYPLNHLHAARHGGDHLGSTDSGENEECDPKGVIALRLMGHLTCGMGHHGYAWFPMLWI
jgi:hypothetical protein